MKLYLTDETSIDNFWRLSTDFYQQPEVKDLMLKLQNEHDKNINEILFALWVSMFYQSTLKSEQVAKILERSSRTKSWVKNIRNTRFDLEGQLNSPLPEMLEQAREAMLESELNIERLHQQRLVESVADELTANPTIELAESILQQNLELLCGEFNDSVYRDFVISYWIDYCRQLSV